MKSLKGIHLEYLDFINKGTIANDVFPEEQLVHYEIACLDHIIDVISFDEPMKLKGIVLQLTVRFFNNGGSLFLIRLTSGLVKKGIVLKREELLILTVRNFNNKRGIL